MKERLNNRYWKRIVNTMNDGLMLISPGGTIIMVNQAFEQQTGYSADVSLESRARCSNAIPAKRRCTAMKNPGAPFSPAIRKTSSAVAV